MSEETPVTQVESSGATTTINSSSSPASDKSKTVALILACIGLLGFGGLHNFYVGKIPAGIGHFLTGGLLYIGTIIDIFNILGGKFVDSDGLPLTKE